MGYHYVLEKQPATNRRKGIWYWGQDGTSMWKYCISLGMTDWIFRKKFTPGERDLRKILRKVRVK